MPTDLCETTEAEGELTHRYRLHIGQAKALASEARIIIVLAGSQGGKTSFVPLWFDQEIQKRGPGDYMAASSTYDLLQMKLLPEMQGYFCDKLGWRYKSSHGGAGIIYGPDTRIIFRSGERPESLESSTVKAAALDEFGQRTVPRESFEAVRRRLTLNRGRILIPTTAYYTEGWLVDLISAAATDPQIDVINFPSYYNPVFPREEWIEQKRFLMPWKFAMMFEGKISRPPAQILCDFRAWDRSSRGPEINGEPGAYGHLVKPFVVPPSWRRVVGVDFGLVNTCIVWLAQNPVYEPGEPSPHHPGPQAEWYVYRTSLGGGKSQSEWARDVLEYRESVAMWLGGAPSEEGHRKSWQSAGVPMIEPLITGDVEARLDHLIGIIRQDRVAVFDHLSELRTQIHTYSREIDRGTDEPTDKILHKERYHFIDAFGYGATGVPRKPAVYRAPAPPETDPRRAELAALAATKAEPRVPATMAIDDYDDGDETWNH